MRAAGPCTFGQHTPEYKEAVCLGRARPLQERVHRKVAYGALPAGGHAPLALVGPRPGAMLGRVHLRVRRLQRDPRSELTCKPCTPRIAESSTQPGPLPRPLGLVPVEEAQLARERANA